MIPNEALGHERGKGKHRCTPRFIDRSADKAYDDEPAPEVSTVGHGMMMPLETIQVRQACVWVCACGECLQRGGMYAG